MAGTPVSGLNRGLALLGALGPLSEALHEADWCEILGTGCFARDTMVLMADGSHEPIQAIRVGDWVQSRNEATGEVEAKQVTGTTAHRTMQTVTVALTDPHTHKTQQIVCTPNHPFYVAGQGFTPAGSLGVGTSIVTRAGPSLAVAAVALQAASAQGTMVYNLTVEANHTYFVGTLGGGAWVHNVTCTISTLSEDWATKGAHLKSSRGIEIKLKPGMNGTIVLRRVFASDSDKDIAEAMNEVQKDLQDPRFRARLADRVKGAIPYVLNYRNSGGVGRSAELNFLHKALTR